MKPGDFVICDQLVDRTSDRPNTFYDGPETTHISFADPYCPTMRDVAIARGRELAIPLHDRGTVVVIEGPRFSTRAESAWFASAGWEVINMTQYPEAVLARELELCYANISLITDYDVGVEGVPPVTHEEVVRVFTENNEKLRDLLFAVDPRRCPSSATARARRRCTGARFEVSDDRRTGARPHRAHVQDRGRMPAQLGDRIEESVRLIVGREALEEFRVRTLPLGRSGRARVRSSDRVDRPRRFVTSVTVMSVDGRASVRGMFRRRWPLASKVLVAVAVVLGALAFVVVRGYQDRVEALHPAVGAPVAVVTAATDLARGTVLSDDDARRVDRSRRRSRRPGAVARRRDGRRARRSTSDIEAGEIITRSRLAGSTVGPVAALVPDGLRAVVVPSGGSGRERSGPATASRCSRRTAAAGRTRSSSRPASRSCASSARHAERDRDRRRVDRRTPASRSCSSSTATRPRASPTRRTFGQLQVAILGPDAATGTP